MIYLFGSTGMLGNYLRLILTKCNLKFQCISRNDYDILKDSFDKLYEILHLLNKDDIIINCSGLIPQKIGSNEYMKFIKVNVVFPHKLQFLIEKTGSRLIHISTNCVFNGNIGNYTEHDIPDEKSIYGVTKLMGEPEKATVIRTSIIGHELFVKKSLLEWVISKKKGSINGYINHYWNGVTCLTLANIIKDIITKNLFWIGVRHIFSPDIINKYELCNLINKIYNLNIDIKKYKADYNVNKTLSTEYKDNLFIISSIEEQIIQQKKFELCSFGKYKELSSCRICKSSLNDIFSFTMPLAGGFISKKSDSIFENIYPTTLCFCNNCKTGQIKEIIEKNMLFTNINNNNYFYYSSTIPYLCKHFNTYANMIINKYNPKTILEIGCNDGVLLKQIYNLNNKINCVGIDPSDTIKKIDNNKIQTYNTFFGNEITEKLLKTNQLFDVITSSNCLAHINDIDVIFKNIKRLLKSDGTILIEVHYFKNIIDNLNFDFIYHEHMSYYTISSFIEISKKYNFTIHNVEQIDLHGGSIRIHLKNYNNLFYIEPSLENVLAKEKNIQEDIKTLYNGMNIWKKRILKLLYKEKNINNIIYGYGASGRTNTILSFIDFHFNYIFDDSKYKINNYTPYYHTKILSSCEIYNNKDIKTIFILAWPYASDIIKKHKEFLENGGKFIIILPEIIEITIRNYHTMIND